MRDRDDEPGGPADGDADPPANPEAVARAICLRLLTMRARSRAELAEAMARKNVPDDVGEKVLTRFAEVGLIDDGALAHGMVEADHRGRGLSARAIELRMRRRGVAEPAVQAALHEIDADSELAAARRLAQRKLRSVAHLDPATQTRRLFGLLARRGYGSGLASRVVREVLAENAADSAADNAADGAAGADFALELIESGLD
jgi:regulatory protein